MKVLKQDKLEKFCKKFQEFVEEQNHLKNKENWKNASEPHALCMEYLESQLAIVSTPHSCYHVARTF